MRNPVPIFMEEVKMPKKTKKQMTLLGVGPRFAIISCICAIIIYVLDLNWIPNLSIILPRTFSLNFGILLVVIGFPLLLIPGLTIDKYFSKGKLATKGVYAYIRHPIYGSWIVFIIPGIVLIVNSLLGLTIPIFMYVAFRILIVEEEKYLEEKFGEEYYEYRKKVGGILPKFRSIFKI